MADSNSYASGDWHVREGSEDEFVPRWKEFLEWTRDNAGGFHEAMLIRDSGDPRHFVSFARWESAEEQGAWRSLPEFPQKMGACRELCEEMKGGSYEPVVSVTASGSPDG
jgi:heme-degrading monooxygenase HmoA